MDFRVILASTEHLTDAFVSFLVLGRFMHLVLSAFVAFLGGALGDQVRLPKAEY